MERKPFKQAPLPFTGQKRMFLTHFEPILTEHIPEDGNGWTIIDVFGGSGLLAHTAKRIKPLARVIYNDFDGYTDRLKHINDTNRLRAELFNLIDFLTLIDMTKPPYIFFSSTKSEFMRFIEYKVESRQGNWQAFEGAKRLVVNAALNYQVKYEDNLVYKF